MGKWTMEQLRTAHSGTKVLKNAVNYEILSNQAYVTAFQYTPIERCDTEEELAVSDVIMKVLYMGYTKNSNKDFDFRSAMNRRAARRTM